jgi:predicted Zn-dependent protease
VSKPGTRAATFVSALFVVASCVRNPATGKLQFNFVSRDEEIELGKEGAKQVEQTTGLYQESASLERYVEALGKTLAAQSERPKLPWSFHVVDDASVNAFALPGGEIYVTRGILAHLENEAQLASVMGHEVGHVTARHTATQMSKATLAQAGLGLGAMLSDTFAQLLPLGSAGMQLLFLKFSRDDERQADTLGLRYALRAGYDVREMPKVFEMLGRVSEPSEGKLPSWLATHPDPAERVKNTEARVAALHVGLDNRKVGRDAYLAQLHGLVYGDDPREGFFEGDTFYQPQLAFKITFPEGWQKENMKEAVLASSPEGDAALQLTLAAEDTAEAAAKAFVANSGATLTSSLKARGRAVIAQFVLAGDDTDLAGVMASLVQGEHTYRILGISTPERIGTYERDIMRVVDSVDKVTEPAILAAKPNRIEIARLSEPTSLEALHDAHPGVPLAELALLNELSEGATLSAGQTVKYVVGERMVAQHGARKQQHASGPKP